MGRVHPKKGVDILIEAFARTLAKDPQWELVIAGPDQVGQQAELQSLAQRLGISERITWTGMISGEMKWGALASSEVFVLPSHQENFGIVVAEALACKLPVIISDKVNIWLEIKEHNAGLICQDNVQSTREALEKWSKLNNDERSAICSQTLKCFDECFNYNRIASRVLQVTETISSESGRR